MDTTVLVSADRSGNGLRALIEDDDDVAIAAITAAELLVGVELAGKHHHDARRDFMNVVLTTVLVEDYDLVVARSHAVLLAQTRVSGQMRGAHDLIIAATALARQRTVVTLDTAGFRGLRGVDVRS